MSNAHLMDPSTGGGRNATTTTYLRSVRPCLFRGVQTARTSAAPGVSSASRLLDVRTLGAADDSRVRRVRVFAVGAV